MDPFGRGQLAKPLEHAAFALAPGQVSEVLSTPEGFQILRLESRSEAISISEDAARARVRSFLQEIKAREAVSREAERLRAVGEVTLLLPL
jgi:peptidyl-prolyl cis-trans isomerase C